LTAQRSFCQNCCTSLRKCPLPTPRTNLVARGPTHLHIIYQVVVAL
jgi:hypothetical protein